MIAELNESIAARSIANNWLESASSIIARGEKPAKLSEQAERHAVATFEPGEPMDFMRYSKASVKRIAALSVKYALEKLRDGKFLDVREHFRLRAKEEANKKYVSLSRVDKAVYDLSRKDSRKKVLVSVPWGRSGLALKRLIHSGYLNGTSTTEEIDRALAKALRARGFVPQQADVWLNEWGSLAKSQDAA